MNLITATTKFLLLFLLTIPVAIAIVAVFERTVHAGTTIIPNPVVCIAIPGNDGVWRSSPDRCPAPPPFHCPGGYQCRNCSEQIPGISFYNDRWTCAIDTSAGGISIPAETSTEIGTLQSEPGRLILSFIQIFAGLAGGISLLLAIAGAVKYLTSSGNPEAVEEAKETITHALGGFLLVFLSVFLLRFIGIDLLGIPGFSRAPGGGVTVP